MSTVGSSRQEPAVPGGTDPQPPRLDPRDFAQALRTTAVSANVLLAALSAGLAIWAEGVGRYLLVGLLVILLLLFFGRIAVAWVTLRQRAQLQLLETRHQQELSEAREEVARATQRAADAATETAAAREQVARFRERASRAEGETQLLRSRHNAIVGALKDMWAGYPAPCTDEVELTYVIGEDGASDRVVEHRRTTPYAGAALPFLQARLTTPTDLDVDTITLVETDIVTRSEDDRIAIRQFPLVERPGLLRCMFVFTPAIAEPESWFARYRMPGMWNVLRATGHDRLTWTPSPRVADPSRSTATRLTVRFDFPLDAGDDVFVRDRDNRELLRTVGPEGSLRFEWTTDSPAPELYSWELWWARRPAADRDERTD